MRCIGRDCCVVVRLSLLLLPVVSFTALATGCFPWLCLRAPHPYGLFPLHPPSRMNPLPAASTTWRPQARYCAVSTRADDATAAIATATEAVAAAVAAAAEERKRTRGGEAGADEECITIRVLYTLKSARQRCLVCVAFQVVPVSAVMAARPPPSPEPPSSLSNRRAFLYVLTYSIAADALTALRFSDGCDGWRFTIPLRFVAPPSVAVWL